MVDGTDCGVLRLWLEQVHQAGEMASAGDEELLLFAVSHAKGSLQSVLHAAYKEKGLSLGRTLKSSFAVYF